MITFDAGDLASTTAYIGVVFDDFKLLIFVIIGLSIGFGILGAVFDTWKIFKPKKDK